MAYIDELRKYTDQTVYGQGGVNLGGLVKAIQSFFKPQPAPKPAAKPAAKPASKPVAQAPRPMPVPTPKPTPVVASRPPSQPVTKPTPLSAPVSTPQNTMVNKTVAPTASKPTQVVQPKSNNAMNDVRNFGSSLVNILGAASGQSKGMVPLSYNYSNELRKLAGGTIGGLGTLATAAIKNIPGVSTVYAAGYNPLEFNVSEKLAGTYQEPKQTLKSGSLAGETSGQALGATTTAPKFGPLKTGYVTAPGYTQADAANKDAIDTQRVADTGYAKANQENQDIYAILSDPNTQAQIEQANEAVYQEYVNGNISFEDYQRRANEEQKKIIANQYARARQEAESQIPGIESDAKSLIESALTGLNRYTAAADQEAARQDIIAKENEKQVIKNRKVSEGTLRNVFSNLGTTESSAFIDKMIELDKEAQAQQDRNRSEGARVVGDISKQKLYEIQDTNKYITDTKEKSALDIENIRRYIRNLSGEETDQVSNLISNLYNALATGQQNLADKKALLADRKAQQAYNTQNMAQSFGLQSALQDREYKALQGLQGVTPNSLIGQTVRPQGLPADMWSLAGQLYNSGLRGTALINQLMKRNGIGWGAWYDTLKNQLAQ